VIRFVDGGPRAENYSGRINLPQFGIRLARGSWTIRCRIPGPRNCRGGRSLCTSVRVATWVLERTKLRRSDRPYSSLAHDAKARRRRTPRWVAQSSLLAVCPLGLPHLRAQAKSRGFTKKQKKMPKRYCRGSPRSITPAIRPRVLRAQEWSVLSQ